MDLNQHDSYFPIAPNASYIYTEPHKIPGPWSIHSLACENGLFNDLKDGNCSMSMSLNCVNSQAPEQEENLI